MEKRMRKSYFKIEKVYSFIPLFLLFLFLNLSFTSAIAQFNTIPFQQRGFNSYNEINLRNYCSSSQAGNFCRDTSFAIKFTNPENNNQVNFLGSGELSNSYFTITLINGLIQISSKLKVMNTSIIVYGADTEYSSQASTSFLLNIIESNQPEQISSFLSPILYGNNSVTYDLNNFFLNYNQIRVNYNDDILNRVVSLQVSKTTSQTSSGRIRVILTGLGDKITLTIQGLNQTYNSSTSGGNLFFVTAINPYGETLGSPPFPVVTYPSGPSITYSNLPIRAPLSIAPLYLQPNQTYDYNLSKIYGNYTYLIVNWSSNNSGNLPLNWANTQYNNSFNWITLYKNGTQTVCGYTLDGTITYFCNTQDANLAGLYGAQMLMLPYIDANGIKPFDFIQFHGGNLGFNNYLSQIGMAGFQLAFNLSACNNIGCINTDDFGNRDILYINVSATPPSAVPLTFAPIEMGFLETKFFNFNQMFSNYNYLILNWSQGTENFSLRTPTTNYNSTTFISGGAPIYQVRLYSNNLLAVTSAQTSINFTIYPIACNSVYCIDGTLGIPQSITFIIQDLVLGTLGTNQVSDNLFRNMFNLFLGLFPDKDTLNSQSKINIAFITIAIVIGLMLFFGYKSGGNLLPLVYFSGIIAFFVFIFFIAKGYLSPLYLVVFSFLGLIFAFLKYRGSA